MFSIVCCACMKGLGAKSGTLVEVTRPDATGGLINLDMLRSFESAKEADLFAERAGWKTHDTHGPNHRCPPCVLKESQGHTSSRRGMYVEVPG